MSTNETLIDEICAELEQLCTDLEKIKAIPKKNYSEGIAQDRGEQHAAPPSNRNNSVRNLEQAGGNFTRGPQDNRYL
jgi:hypothetical protein